MAPSVALSITPSPEVTSGGYVFLNTGRRKVPLEYNNGQPQITFVLNQSPYDFCNSNDIISGELIIDCTKSKNDIFIDHVETTFKGYVRNNITTDDSRPFVTMVMNKVLEEVVPNIKNLLVQKGESRKFDFSFTVPDDLCLDHQEIDKRRAVWRRMAYENEMASVKHNHEVLHTKLLPTALGSWGVLTNKNKFAVDYYLYMDVIKTDGTLAWNGKQEIRVNTNTSWVPALSSANADYFQAKVDASGRLYMDTEPVGNMSITVAVPKDNVVTMEFTVPQLEDVPQWASVGAEFVNFRIGTNTCFPSTTITKDDLTKPSKDGYRRTYSGKKEAVFLVTKCDKPAIVRRTSLFNELIDKKNWAELPEGQGFHFEYSMTVDTNGCTQTFHSCYMQNIYKCVVSIEVSDTKPSVMSFMKNVINKDSGNRRVLEIPITVK